MHDNRRARVAVAAVALLTFAGCTDSARVDADGPDPGEAAPTTSSETTTTAMDQRDAELTGSVPPEAPHHADCPPPHLPLTDAELEDVSFGELESVAIGPQSPPVLDSDGDGEVDEVVRTPEGLRPTVRRGDGELVFARDGEQVSVVPLADLDADGRSELLVAVGADSPLGPAAVYVVPGTTEVGVHDPADVGIRIPRAAATVGDHDGDDVEDLLEYDGRPPTRVLSGAAVMAAGAGGDARSVEPLRYLPGTALAHAPLDGSTTWFTTDVDAEGGDGFTIHVTDDAGLHRFTSPPGGSTAPPTLGSLQVFTGERGTFMMVAPTERSAGSGALGRHVWRLDDPCGSA